MGINYRVWIIPKQRTYRPDAEQVASLANALRYGRWVPQPQAPGQRSHLFELLPGESVAGKKPFRLQAFDSEPFTPGWVEFHSQHEMVMDWHVQNLRDAAVQYPFTFDPYPDSGPPYFYVRVVLGNDDYFHWTGENVGEFEEAATKCVCGEQLAFWTGWAQGVGSQRIHAICPKCERAFDPSKSKCEVRDGWTGAATSLLGGLTFRFALVVDCHKYFPREEHEGRRFDLRVEFLDLWREFIGVPFELVATFD
jgi:hypothetical protein